MASQNRNIFLYLGGRVEKPRGFDFVYKGEAGRIAVKIVLSSAFIRRIGTKRASVLKEQGFSSRRSRKGGIPRLVTNVQISLAGTLDATIVFLNAPALWGVPEPVTGGQGQARTGLVQGENCDDSG